MKTLIKDTVVGKMRLYDKLYKIADFLLKKHNPCKFSNGKCGGSKSHMFKEGCCVGCNYLKEDGCSVKALYCKLWVCGTVNTDTLYMQLNVLKKIAFDNDLLDCRERKSYTRNKLKKTRRRKLERKEYLRSLKLGVGFKNRMEIAYRLHEGGLQ